MKTSKLEQFASKDAQGLTKEDMKQMIGDYPITCHCDDGIHIGEANSVKDAWELCSALCGD